MTNRKFLWDFEVSIGTKVDDFHTRTAVAPLLLGRLVFFGFFIPNYTLIYYYQPHTLITTKFLSHALSTPTLLTLTMVSNVENRKTCLSRIAHVNFVSSLQCHDLMTL